MVIHLVSHIEHDALGYLGVYVVLNSTDDTGDCQRSKSEQKQLNEQSHILAHKGFIHDAPGEYGRQQTDDGGYDDRDEHQQKLRNVGLEVGENAQKQFLRDLGHVLLFFFR